MQECLTKQDIAIINCSSAISVGKGMFDYADHSKSKFTIEDIATSLSKICRYTGHVRDNLFYSVAEHCVHVSRMVPPEMALEGLMHDAPEAFIGDVNSVLKQFIGPKYKELDRSVSQYLSSLYGYQYPYPREVKVTDGRMYRTETPIVTYDNDDYWLLDLKPYDSSIIRCWQPTRARKEFLTRFEVLTRERNAVLQPQAEERAAAA